jgi:hypothetical protein
MLSELNTSFQLSVSGEEKKRRFQERIICPVSFIQVLVCNVSHPTAERAGNKGPAQYLLTVKQTVENDYVVLSYLADVFNNPDGWDGDTWPQPV